MPKRHIGINRNNKDVLFGVHSKSSFDRYWAVQDRDEAIDYRIELKDWLDSGETIQTVTESSNSLTSSKTVNTTSVDYLLEGCGYLEATITTTSGNKKTVKLDIVDPCRNYTHGYRAYEGYYGY